MKPTIYLFVVTIAALISLAATVPYATAPRTSFTGSEVRQETERANDPSRMPLVQTPSPNTSIGVATQPEQNRSEPNQGITKTWDDRFRQNPTADSDAEEVRERARGTAE